MRIVLITLIVVCVYGSVSHAQPVITPRNMALGGGGSTYLTDYNTNFYNPANLMIQDKKGSFDVGVLVGGFYFEGIQNYSNLEKQYKNAQDYITRYKPGAYSISNIERGEILDDHYSNNKSLSNNKTARYDVTLLGMKWKKENTALSLAFRTRTASSYSVGKGWYSPSFSTVNGEKVLDRSLIHRYQSLHEISFGYAESFQFLTNLTSRLDNFVIGIAPKLVFGGSYQDAVWDNRYYRDSNDQVKQVQSFTFAATGDFGTVTSSYLSGRISAEDAVSRNFNNDEYSLDGIGAGLDVGVTYLLTFGSDLSAVRPGKQPTQKSVRFSFSMTDIGFVSYPKNDLSLNIFTDTTQSATVPSSVSDEVFLGVRGQYLDFIDRYGEGDNPFMSASRDNSGFSILLPMALHGGALLEINRLKLMGDVSVGLTNNSFNSTTLVSSVGIELRPFLFLPLRAGTQFEAQRPRFLSLGTAIETKYWDFSVAAQFTPESLLSEVALAGISLATLQLHF